MKKQILTLALAGGVVMLWQLRMLETAVLACAFLVGAIALLTMATGAASGRHALGRALSWLERRVAP